MNIYIQEEIFTRLPEAECNLLAFASVYRYGVPKDILLERSEGGFDTIKDLTDRALLEHNQGIYNVHDLIREFFYETQPASVRLSDHSQAANHFMKYIDKLVGEGYGESRVSVKDPEMPSTPELFEEENPLGLAVIEGMYHLINSQRVKEASELSSKYGEKIIELDLSEELKELLHQLPQDELDGKNRAMVLMLLGEIYNHLRDMDAAQNYYIEALSAFRLIHGESVEPRRMALIYRRLGFIAERRDEWDEAKECHEKSLELAEKARDALAISDAYGALGWLHWSFGDHEKANDFYNKCIGMADNIAELPGKAKIYLGICMALAKRGELEEALEYYEKCLDILERNEDIFKLARSYEGMGDHYLRSIFSEFMKSSGKKLKED
jgi:tetratricopeptide (TPR) repeat protein